MENTHVRIIRKDKIYSIYPITTEEAKQQIGYVTRDNFVIKLGTPKYDSLIEIVKKIPNEGKFTKLTTLINKLYNNLNDYHPQAVKSPTLPLSIINEQIALVLTKDMIKSVYSNGIKSSRTRVHVNYITAQEFLRCCNGELHKSDADESTWVYWNKKANDIFNEQIHKVAYLRKEELKNV